MAETPIIELHQYGVTRYATGPLKDAGYLTAEKVAELVAAHRKDPSGSQLAAVPGMGSARVAAVCEAVDRWNTALRGMNPSN